MPRTNKRPYRPDIHAKCVEAAVTGSLLTYMADLRTSRAMVGKYLSRIAHEEQFAQRPPLTAVVVRSHRRGPGPGFLQAMEEIGYRRPGETEQQVWKRALADVYAYWRPKLDEDDWENWPTHVK